MNKPINVAFASPKGGVGRTMLTVLTASYLHYQRGYNVAVVDCCYPEHGIGFLRKNEIERIEKDSQYYHKARQQFTTTPKKTYAIIDTRVETALRATEALQEVDIIFFDIPALMSVDGTVELLAAMDYIIYPVTSGSWIMNTTQQFAETMNQYVVTTGKSHVRGMYLLRNMVRSNDGAAFHTACQTIADETGTLLLATILPHSSHFQKDVFYKAKQEVCVSTVFPFDRKFTGMLGGLMQEVEQIIKKPCGKSL